MTRKRSDDPLFTTKGLVFGAIFFSFYAVIIFSMDPEWVAWAGPMALGALYVPNTPPPLFSQPAVAFEMASKLSLLSLAALVLLAVLMGEAPFGWLTPFKDWVIRQIELEMPNSVRDVESAERNG